MVVKFDNLDYGHTGHTNNFHVQSGSEFALLYNDRSVLENYHVSACFRLMKDEDKNLFERMTRDEFRWDKWIKFYANFQRFTQQCN